MTTILSFDPGGTTGYVYFNLNHPLIFSGREKDSTDHHLFLWIFLTEMEPDIIVCEDFEYRNVTLKDGTQVAGVELVSRDYIGIIKLYCQMHEEVDLILQKPAVAVGKKPFWHNDKLKKMGLHKKGAPHQNDAMRHLLYYLTTTLKLIEYYEYLKDDYGTLTLR